MRHGVTQTLKMLTTFMNNIQTIDLIDSINKFSVEVNKSELPKRVQDVVVAVNRILRMYCKSALTDFSIQSGK